MFPVLIAAAAPAVLATAAAKAPAAKVTAGPLPPALQNFQFTAPQPKTPLAAHAGWLTHGFAGVFIVAAVMLIFLLAVQTTKQEGLSGTIGGRVESAYRGRLGADQHIARFTAYAGIAYVVFATLLSITGI